MRKELIWHAHIALKYPYIKNIEDETLILVFIHVGLGVINLNHSRPKTKKNRLNFGKKGGGCAIAPLSNHMAPPLYISMTEF